MRFSYQSFLVGAGLFSLANLGLASDCAEGPFGSGALSGKGWDEEGGGVYCDTKWKEGKVVTGVEVWANKHHVKAIQLTFSDGSKGPIRGNPDGDDDRHGKINWNAEDAITKIQRWDNRKGDGVGRILIEVAGQKLDAGSKTKGDGDFVDVHSGIMLGAHGKNGDFLDSLEWKMMGAKVGEAKIVDIKFEKDLEEWNKKKEGIEGVTLSSVYFKNTNDNGQNKTYTFKNSETAKISKTIEQSNSNMFGTKVGVTVSGGVGVPFLAESKIEVSTEVSYHYTNMKSESTTEEDTRTLEWWESGTISPGRAVFCESSAFKGTFNGDYMSTVEIEMVDGKTFKIDQPGKFKSVGWSTAVSNCKDIPLKEAPDNALEANDDDAPSKTEKRAVSFRA